MEPISLDTIEQADFFVSLLDAKQVKEWEESYMAKQPYLTNFFNVAETFHISKTQQDFVFRCYLIIFISFNYYGFTFPELEKEEHLKVIYFWRDFFTYRGKNPSNYKRQKIFLQESKQTVLSNYISQKFSEAKVGTQSLFSPDNPVPILNLLMLIDFLHKEVEKLEGESKEGSI
jgi:hypothetical protein